MKHNKLKAAHQNRKAKATSKSLNGAMQASGFRRSKGDGRGTACPLCGRMVHGDCPSCTGRAKGRNDKKGGASW